MTSSRSTPRSPGTSTTSPSSEGSPRTRSPPTGATSRRYARFLASRDVAERSQVDEALVRSFLASVSASTHGEDDRPYRATSVARILSSVRSFHRFLLREGVTDRDPAAGVAQPKLPRSLPHPLTVDEVERLLDAADRVDARRPARPRDPRAAVRVGPARLRAHRARCRRRRPRGGVGAGARARAARSARSRSAASGARRSAPTSPRARPVLRDRARSRRAVPEPARRTALAAELRPHGARRGPKRRASTATCRRTRCATRSPPTCSKVAPTCGSCRSCWGTRAWPRPRSTPW